MKLFLEPTTTESLFANWPRPEAGMVITILPPRSQGWNVHTVCLFPYGVKEKVLALPNFPGPPFYASMVFSGKFRIDSVPGVGKGMFSTRDIKAGEIITEERPLLLAPVGLPFDKENGGPHPDAALQTMVEDEMDFLGRAIFMNLHNCKGSDRTKIRGILDTNGLGLSAMPGHDARYFGVFEHISRINHR
jgi:hypothetical protein